MQGWYLRQGVVVAAHYRNGVRFMLLEHCHLVCKAVSGKGRGRTPMKEAKTLCKLRDVAQSRTFLGFQSVCVGG